MKKTMKVEIDVPIPEVALDAAYEQEIKELKNDMARLRRQNTKLRRQIDELHAVKELAADIKSAHSKIMSALENMPYWMIERIRDW